MKDLNILNNVEMMSTLEICELTGKRHTHTVRLVRSLINKELIRPTQFGLVEYKAGNGEMRPMYMLDKTASILVVAQQSPEFTAAMIDRWQALEAEKVSQHRSSPLSKSYDDFLREIQAACKDNPELIKCFAHLGSKAMTNARRAKKWYREQFLPHFRVILGIAEPGDTAMLGYTDDPTTLEQVSYKFTRQWTDLLYLSCSSQNDLFAI